MDSLKAWDWFEERRGEGDGDEQSGQRLGWLVTCGEAAEGTSPPNCALKRLRRVTSE